MAYLLNLVGAGDHGQSWHICVVVELMAMNSRQGSPLVTIITLC